MEIMNLIDYNNIGGCSDSITLMKDFNTLIEDKLNKGLTNNKLIYTQELRGIGKTYQLVEFARKHGFAVIVPNFNSEKIIKEKYNYYDVYYVKSNELTTNVIYKAVVDEGVDINEIKEKNIKIITGFTMKKYIDENIQDKVIKSLNNDTEIILNKLQKSLDNGNDSNYKMLINNLRETIGLIKNLEGLNNNPINISNVNVSSDCTDFIKQLEQLTKTTKDTGHTIGNSLKSISEKVYNGKSYYRSNSTEDRYMKYDKEYVKSKALDKNEFIKILAENDIPYLDDVYNSDKLRGYNNIANEYLKLIYSLPQYKNLRFKDSKF